MELYNDPKNYQHPDINNLLSEDLTCTFTIKIHNTLENHFQLIDKGERGELYVRLSKDNRIVIYYGNKIKTQIASSSSLGISNSSTIPLRCFNGTSFLLLNQLSTVSLFSFLAFT